MWDHLCGCFLSQLPELCGLHALTLESNDGHVLITTAQSVLHEDQKKLEFTCEETGSSPAEGSRSGVNRFRRSEACGRPVRLDASDHLMVLQQLQHQILYKNVKVPDAHAEPSPRLRGRWSSDLSLELKQKKKKL